jgi:hypothetical protein
MSDRSGGGRMGRGPVPAETGSDADEPQPAIAIAAVRVVTRDTNPEVDMDAREEAARVRSKLLA